MFQDKRLKLIGAGTHGLIVEDENNINLVKKQLIIRDQVSCDELVKEANIQKKNI